MAGALRGFFSLLPAVCLSRLPVVFLCISLAVLTGSCDNGSTPARSVERTIYVADSIIFQRNGQTVGMMIPGVDGPLYHVVEHPAPASRRDLIVVSLVVTFLSLLLFLLFVFLLQRKERKIGRLSEEVDRISRRSDQVSQVLSGLIEDRVSMIETLSGHHDAMHMPAERSYLNELEKLRDRVDHYDQYIRELRNDDQFVGDLEHALNVSGDNIMARLRETFSTSFKEEDYRFLACVFAGIGNAGIGFVTGFAPGTVRTRKSRYKSRIQALPDSSGKEFFLKAFEKGVL